MSKVNPKEFSWEAPTERVDGQPIEYDLNYEVGVVQPDSSGGTTVVPKYTVVGSLREADGKYVAPIEDMSFDYGSHTVTLRAFSTENPDLKSEWSNTTDFLIENANPSAPLALAVS